MEKTVLKLNIANLFKGRINDFSSDRNRAAVQQTGTAGLQLLKIEDQVEQS